MASGKLGSAAPAAGVATTVYTPPAGTVAAASLTICNRGATTSTISVAIFSAGAVTNADYIEYGTALIANGVLERSGLVVGPGEKVVVTDSAGTCSVRVHGYEAAQ